MKVGDIVTHIATGQLMEIMSVYTRKQPGGLLSERVISCRWTDESNIVRYREFVSLPSQPSGFTEPPP